MWTRKLLKENAMIAFLRNYWACVLVNLVIGMAMGQIGLIYFRIKNNFPGVNLHIETPFSMISNIGYKIAKILSDSTMYVAMIVASFALLTFFINIVELGGKRYYIENREHKTSFTKVFFGFAGGNYGHFAGAMFSRNIKVFLWSLLFVVPGVIKSLSYKMVPYILAENPSISKERALELSSQMMDGHKKDAFKLTLSFMGWNVLSMFTLQVLGVFRVFPYKNATYAEFYTALKAEALRKGITSTEELPGVAYKQQKQPESVEE